MKNKNWVLLRTLLKSTSQLQVLKYSTDKKKRGRVVGNIIGLAVLYLFIMGYCVATCVGYGMIGITDSIPAICALVITAVAFLFTILKTNGYLFNFKEYDMLMSLPFEAKSVAGAKFLYMYLKSIPWYGSISISMMIGYGIYARPGILVYPVWILLSLALPIIPMLVASFLGFLIARISTGFRKTNIVQVILTFVLMIFCFSLRFIIEALFRDGQVMDTLNQISDITDQIGRVYLPAGWFCNAVTELAVADMLLLLGLTIFLFDIVFIPVGKSYRKINSMLKSHASAKAFSMSKQKKKRLVQTIAHKEWKRMTGSTIYMTNAGMGEIMTILLGIVVLFVGIDQVIATVTQDAPFSASIVYPAIPLIVYFLIGMVPSTCCSPSLEGKNYWIVQSLPIEKKVLYQGKMLFNLYLTVPCAVFATVCMCISARVPILSAILYVIEIVILCGFSTAWGCVCGMKHMRLDWENEVEVVKQGAAVAIYLFPNMLITMGLCVLVVVLGMQMDPNIVSLVITFFAAILASISYLRVMALAKKI